IFVSIFLLDPRFGAQHRQRSRHYPRSASRGRNRFQAHVLLTSGFTTITPRGPYLFLRQGAPALSPRCSLLTRSCRKIFRDVSGGGLIWSCGTEILTMKDRTTVCSLQLAFRGYQARLYAKIG